MGLRYKKSLLISDLDGTIVDMWNAWGQATRRAVSRIAYVRDMSVESVEKILVDTARTHNISLVDDLGQVVLDSPLLKKLSPQRVGKIQKLLGIGHEEIDHYILRQWWRDRDRFSTLHRGVESTLQNVRQQGAHIVIYSDSPITLVLHRLWVSGFHPDLVDRIYCRADQQGVLLRGLKHPDVGSHEHRFKILLMERSIIFSSAVKKPSLGCMNHILSDFSADPNEVVMIGDHAVDIASARLIEGITAVWDIDGARVSSGTIEQYKRLNQWEHYGIGEQSIRNKMLDLAVEPDIVLDRRFDQLTQFVEFVRPGEVHARQNGAGSEPQD